MQYLREGVGESVAVGGREVPARNDGDPEIAALPAALQPHAHAPLRADLQVGGKGLKLQQEWMLDLQARVSRPAGTREQPTCRWASCHAQPRRADRQVYPL
jgi:hypothetical protein